MDMEKGKVILVKYAMNKDIEMRPYLDSACGTRGRLRS